MKVLYISNIVKVSQQKVEWFWRYSVLIPYTLNIQQSLKHAWHCGIGFLRCLAAKVLKEIVDRRID